MTEALTGFAALAVFGFILAFALVNGAIVTASLAAAAALSGWSTKRFHHFAQALIPLAGAGVFLGLSALTVTLLAQDGIRLGFVQELRVGLLAGAAGWALWLGWRIAGLYAPGPARRLLALAALAPACASTLGAWYLLFWIW